ncbi:MAG: hypothetical protein JM58_19495 [Peptococcaceae bacterium BICA1-8]|nr:MAG: hypothetical protein JM58_19495 [Peptococcaceae bacterium BICA1-8]
MFVVTGKEMAAIDKIAVEEWNIPELVLMENAGLRVVEEIKEHFPTLNGKKVIIIAGKGNNGGDGLVIARHLINMGADVRVFTLGAKEYQGAALVNYRIAQKLPIKWHNIENENSLHLLRLSLHYTDIIIDALYGTGFNGSIQGLAKKVIEIINENSSLTLAVDVPSGLDADSGKVQGSCIKADVTLTFQLPKLGLVVQSGYKYTGKLKVVDISIPVALIEDLKIKKHLITKEMVVKDLPYRYSESHKGNFGHVLIIGGSQGMMGAVNLAARGAFAMGAGLVTAVVPKSIQPTLATSLPELITYPATETPQGTLGLVSGPEIIEVLSGKSVVILGPGMGRNSEILPFLTWLLVQLKTPLVIDADGLNALAERLDILKEATVPIILTPHPGEMSRLLDLPIQDIQENRWERALDLAHKYGIWVVLKGNKTVIASPKGEIFINPTGSPALAAAGTGDVLAGMIGSLLGQVNDISQALCAAVYLHGLAGEEAARQVGEISSKAGDIVSVLPQVIKKVSAEQQAKKEFG